MKAHLYIMGQYRGQIEVGDDSLVGRLARLDFGGATEKAQEMVDDLNEIPGVTADFGTENPTD